MSRMEALVADLASIASLRPHSPRLARLVMRPWFALSGRAPSVWTT